MRLIDADKAIEAIDEIFDVGDSNAAIPLGITKALVRSMLMSKEVAPTVESNEPLLTKVLKGVERHIVFQINHLEHCDDVRGIRCPYMEEKECVKALYSDIQALVREMGVK